MAMKRILPVLLLPLLTACGSNALLLEYVIDVNVNAHESLGSHNVDLLDIGPCTNAEVFDETLMVYSGYSADDVLAVRVNWSGFDLAEGGDNYHYYLAGEDENAQIRAAFLPDLVLFEVDRKGKIHPVADEVQKSGKRTYTADYELGLGLPIVEEHTISKSPNEIQFIQEATGNCSD